MQNAFLRSLINFFTPKLALFTIFIAGTFTIPGLIGNTISLILLNIKKNNVLYDGIIHYYGLIFSMDLLIVINSIPNEFITYSLNVLLNLKLSNLISVLSYLPFCKLSS